MFGGAISGHPEDRLTLLSNLWLYLDITLLPNFASTIHSYCLVRYYQPPQITCYIDDSQSRAAIEYLHL
jgi:hypothetical protein